jgi:hypothetical protein
MASRKEEKEQRRQERLAREQAEQARSRQRRLYAIIVGAVLAGAAVVAVVIAVAAGGGGAGSGNPGGVSAQDSFPDATDPPVQKITNLDEAAKAANCVLRNPPIEGNSHVTDATKVVYKTNPPTSGNHNPIPADDGYYSQRPGVRHSTHTLEHGRIYIQYKPTLSPRRIKQLGGLFNDDSYHMLLSPNPSMPYRVAATAWGHLAGCKKVTDATFDVLRDFRDRYRDRAPEQVP